MKEKISYSLYTYRGELGMEQTVHQVDFINEANPIVARREVFNRLLSLEEIYNEAITSGDLKYTPPEEAKNKNVSKIYTLRITICVVLGDEEEHYEIYGEDIKDLLEGWEIEAKTYRDNGFDIGGTELFKITHEGHIIEVLPDVMKQRNSF